MMDDSLEPMNNGLSYEQILELLPAYVLGALEAEEMLAVDAYIEQQRELLTRLGRAEEAAAQLALAAPAAPLPPQAKERLMRRVQVDLAGQEGNRVAEPVSQPGRSERPAPELRRAKGWLAWLGPALGRGGGWAVATGCAVAVLILVVLYAGLMQRQLNQMTVRLDALQSQNEVLQAQLEANQNRLALVVNAGPENIVQVPGTADAPGASGTLYVGDDNQGVLALRGLAPLPPEQTYQLWLARSAEDKPVSAGLLEVEGEGATLQEVEIPPEVQDFTFVGVSVEPEGGSEAPTGVIVLHN